MTTDQENQLLCEKLLDWKRGGDEWWHDGKLLGYINSDTPTFLTGDGMLSLLEAMRALGLTPSLEYNDGKWDCFGGDPYEKWFHAYRDSAPDAVRAAALEYARTKP